MSYIENSFFQNLKAKVLYQRQSYHQLWITQTHEPVSYIIHSNYHNTLCLLSIHLLIGMEPDSVISHLWRVSLINMNEQIDLCGDLNEITTTAFCILILGAQLVDALWRDLGSVAFSRKVAPGGGRWGFKDVYDLQYTLFTLCFLLKMWALNWLLHLQYLSLPHFSLPWWIVIKSGAVYPNTPFLL